MLKVGLVGVGGISGAHIPCWEQMEDAELVALCDIRPEQMKIKLQLIEKLEPPAGPEPLRYQITDGQLERWVYSPPDCERPPVETDFTASSP